MKKQFKMLSLLMAVLMTVSLFGAATVADAAGISGDAFLTVNVSTVRDDMVPATYPEPDADGNWIELPPNIVLIDGEEQEVCTVSFVTRDGTEVGVPNGLNSIIGQDIGIRIVPLDGFFVSGLSLGGAEGGYSDRNILTAAKAHLYDSSVTLFLSDIAGNDGNAYTLDDAYLSSWAGGPEFVLNVTCSRIGDETHSLWYDAGGHNAQVPDAAYAPGTYTTYTASMPETLAYDEDGTVWEFTGYRLEYVDGPWLDVDADDEIVLYTDATLTARWKDVTEEYAQPEEEYVEEYVDDGMDIYTEEYTEDYTEDYVDSDAVYTMDTDTFNTQDYMDYGLDNSLVTDFTEPVIPTVTIEGASASKPYDGSPLNYQDYSVTAGSLGDYTLGVTYNEITDPGSVSNITGYALFNADGTPAFSQDELAASDSFTLIPGTLTVTDAIPTLTIQGDSYEKEYDGQPLTVPQGAMGYTITDGYVGYYYTLRVAFGSRTEAGSTDTLTDYALCDPYGNVVFDKAALDAADNFTVYPGTLTVKEPVHVPTIPTVTVQVDGASKDYDGTELTAAPYTVVSGSLDGYRLEVNYNSQTNPGSVPAVSDYTLVDENYGDVFDRTALDGDDDFQFIIGNLEVRNAVPNVTLTALSKEKEYDETPLTVAEGETAYTITGTIGPYYTLHVEYGSITEVGSTDTISDYYLSDPEGTVVFTKDQLEQSGRFVVTNGTLTVKEKKQEPVDPDVPVIPTAILQGVTESKKYDGEPLTKSGTDGYTLATAGLGKYHLVVEYNTITEVGSVDTLKNYELLDENNTVIFDKAALDESPNFTVIPGKLIIEEADAPTVPTAVLIAASDSKEYDGKPLTKSGTDGYELTGNLGDYQLAVTYNTITEIGSVDTLATYELQKDGKTVFTRDQLDASPNFTVRNGKLTITKPAPSIPKATLTGASESKEYNGAVLTKTGTDGYSVSGSLGDYELRVTYNKIIEPGTVDTLASYALYDKAGNVAFTKEQLDASPNFTVKNGQLKVTPRTLKLIAISGTLNTSGETIKASSLSTPDGSFRNGYRQIGLLEGHQLAGDFVQGSGNQSFKTSINREAVRISANGFDVTKCYDIQTQDGQITIVGPKQYDLIVKPRSYSWTYDGQAHTLREYDYSGLVNGDKLVKVNFSSDSTITNVGSQSNRITSVEVTTASGGDVDVNKYILYATPGTLTVEQRELTVTAISGTLTTTGGSIVASSLSTPDGTFTNGYKVENLVQGHRLSGNFVVGSGTSTFTTSIDLNNLRVLDANGVDVTRNYNIRTVNGTITINSGSAAQQRSNVTLAVTAKSGTFTYDGNEHKLNEYSVSGLVDGDVIEKVNFKPTSVITNVGTQANEIQSVVIKSATGAAVDNSKYNINLYAGTLTVTKFPLTLTAVSDEKVYDGTALNNKSVKASALANASQKLSADYEVFDSNGNTIKNGPVDPGVYTKKVSNVKITSGSTDVTDNYDIKMVDGTLKITGTSGESSRATTSTAYYGSTFTIRSDAPYSEFQYLLIDGQRVPNENYTVKEGSTIITLKSSYIQNLKTGAHNYTIVSKSKQVDGSFSVAKAPKTGDGGSMLVWVILLLLMAAAIALVFFVLQRTGKLGGKKRSSSGADSRGRSSRGKETLRYPSGKEYVRKPAAPVIPELDYEPEPEQAGNDDPSVDLMKDFDLNLDEFRTESTDRQTYTSPYAGLRTEQTAVNRQPAEPDFGSFNEPAKTEEDLPDLEVEIYEEEPEAETVAPEQTVQEEPTPVEDHEAAPTVRREDPKPEEAPQTRRRGKHEAPDPSDPFMDSWYQSVGLGRQDKNK